MEGKIVNKERKCEKGVVEGERTERNCLFWNNSIEVTALSISHGLSYFIKARASDRLER